MTKSQLAILRATHEELLDLAEKSGIWTQLDAFENKHWTELGYDEVSEDYGCDLREGDHY